MSSYGFECNSSLSEEHSQLLIHFPSVLRHIRLISALPVHLNTTDIDDITISS